MVIRKQNWEHDIISGQKNANGTGSFLIQITPSLACRNISKNFFCTSSFCIPAPEINLAWNNPHVFIEFVQVFQIHQANAKKKNGSDSWGSAKCSLISTYMDGNVVSLPEMDGWCEN